MPVIILPEQIVFRHCRGIQFDIILVGILFHKDLQSDGTLLSLECVQAHGRVDSGHLTQASG